MGGWGDGRCGSRRWFSSSVMTFGKKLGIVRSKVHCHPLIVFPQVSRRVCAISAWSVVVKAISALYIAWMCSLLLLLFILEWKNLAFRSPMRRFLSLAFCVKKFSCIRRRFRSKTDAVYEFWVGKQEELQSLATSFWRIEI